MTTPTDSRAPRELRKVERAESVSVAAAEELLAYLLSGAVEAGSRLPSERELAERLGVGRTAVREALKPLALLGVVDVRQGNGTFFRGTASALLPRVIEWSLLLGDRTVADLIEARAPIEVALARFAAQHRDADQLAELAAALKTMEAADPATFAEADAAFHLGVAEASGNRVLAGVLHSIRELLSAWIRTVVEDQKELRTLYGLHRMVYLAIEAGDPDAAEATMKQHMDQVTASLESAVASHAAH